MTRLILLFFTLLSSLFTALAQPTINWAKCFGGTGIDVAKSIIQTNDGGYLVLGSTNSLDGDVIGLHDSLGAIPDYWLIKLDSSGTIQWQKCLGGSAKDFPTCLIKTKDSGYAICGYTWSIDGEASGNNNYYSSDFWIIKFGANDSIIWEKTYGGYADDWAYTLAQTSDGGFVVAGNTKSSDGEVVGLHGMTDFWVIKLDTAGTLIWNKCYGGSGDETANSILQTTDGGYIICGFTNSSDGDITFLNKDNKGKNTYDIWVIKTDTSGEIQWQKTYGGAQQDYGNSILQTVDGGYAIFGTSDFGSNGQGYYYYDDYWLIKIDTAGIIQWQKSYGGSDYDEASTMIQTNDGGFLLAGYVLSNDMEIPANNGSYDTWIVKTDSLGMMQWNKNLGGSRDDIPYSIIETNDGGCAIAGSTISFDGDVHGLHENCSFNAFKMDSICNPDWWIVKLNPYIPQPKMVAPNHTSVYVYPNPFDKEAMLLFRLDSLPENTVLNIYNVTGQVVRSIAIISDSNTLTIYREGLSKGVYICKVIQNNKEIVAIGKLVIE